MTRPTPQPPPDREWVAVLALTAIAAVLRLAGFGRLGLDHFDEGIYASAGLWSLSPAGLAGIDPGVIPYAPPGYPILVGLAYRWTGPSDLSAIAVSIVAGIAAIAIVAWLGRRTFGPGFGAAAAGFAAGSIPHITFSRMALTDATFLTAWLAAMVAGGRFLERPGAIRAIILGLAVGVAQLVKYNGWLAGAIVAAAAALGPIVSADERMRRSLLRTFGWGALAAVVAALVDAPWVRFVEVHGGYAGLLAHQRGYLDGPSAWPANWLTQLRQLVALGGSAGLGATLGPLLAILGLLGIAALEKRLARGPMLGVIGLAIVALSLYRASTTWWIGLGLAGFLVRDAAPAARMVAVWWAVLSVLTPMYHPYARLWLPLEAAGWAIGGLVLGSVFRWAEAAGTGRPPVDRAKVVAVALAVVAGWAVPGMIRPAPRPLPGAIGSPRDSFRVAVARLVAKVPPDVATVRMFGRPPLAFYATGPLARRRVEAVRLGSFDDLLRPGNEWAIVDAVQLRQEGVARERLLGRWEIVAEEPTVLSNATLLDVDPAAAVGDLSARVEPLLLLRPSR